MGFTSGFVGGFTLTSSILYLSLAIHQRNRIHQSTLLKQQSLLLTSIVEPLPPIPPPTAREQRTSFVETAKDRWNDEVEGAVRRLQRTDWSALRIRLEDKVSAFWGTGMEKGREGVQYAEDDIIKSGAEMAMEKGREGVQYVKEELVQPAAERAINKGREGALYVKEELVEPTMQRGREQVQTMKEQVRTPVVSES
ncbi:MAG: hypothetical protein M1812_006875 [Candelaria pacifica]|nr:MAG: hypothetical protein M1812_006875 [Candelaria pacifica]